MRSAVLVLGAAAGVVLARPQDCSVSTTLVIQPTVTQTYSSTPVVTVYPTAVQDLGTFTQIETLTRTSHILTLTSTVSSCSTLDGL